jgi:hypothetical protein
MAENSLRTSPSPDGDLAAAAHQLEDRWATVVWIDPARLSSLGRDERERLDADLSALAAARVSYLFPRGEDGRVRLGTTVLLETYGAEVDRGRRPWLHVSSPTSRRTRTLTIGLEPLIGPNHEHRWDAERWAWDGRRTPRSLARAWGHPTGAAAARMRRCLDDLDRGHLDEALGRYGITYSAQVAAVLAGVPLSTGHAHLADRWRSALAHGLQRSAPWKWANAATRKPQRLFTFPGQRQARKASLMLVEEDGVPRLTVEHTGTNRRLASSAWSRWPVEDIARLKLATVRLPTETARPEIAAPPRADEEAIATRLRDMVLTRPRSAYDTALRHGRRLSADRAAAALRDPLADDDPAVRRLALDVAAALRLTDLAGTATAALDDEDPGVRRAATGLLRRIRHEPALPVIAARMVADSGERFTGASAIRGWGDEPGVPAVRSLLRSADPNVRAAACLTLVQYGGKALVDDLVDLAAGDVPLVAGAALHALATLEAGALERASERVRGRPAHREVLEYRQRFSSYTRI